MAFLIANYWIWLAVALVIGLVVALVSQRYPDRAVSPYWAGLVAAAFAIALASLAAGAPDGRAGILLETAVLLGFAYIAGGGLGALFGGRWPARHSNWWGALALLAAVWILADLAEFRDTEGDLRTRIASLIDGADGDPNGFDLAGRDVQLLSGNGSADLQAQIRNLAGVRTVREVSELTGPAATIRALAEETGTAEQALEQSSARIAELEAELTRLKDEAASAATERTAAEQAAKTATDGAAARIAELEAEVASKTDAVAAAERAATGAADTAKARIAELEAAASAANARAEAEAAARATAEESARTADRAATASAAQVIELQQQFAANAAQVVELQGQIAATPAVVETTEPAATDGPTDEGSADPAASTNADVASAEPETAPEVAECRAAVAALLEQRPVLFPTGSARLPDASLDLVREIGGMLGQCPTARVEIAGHTDARGSDRANQLLSLRRAQAVWASLREAAPDIAAMYPLGYGAVSPIASNDSEAGRASNRRIEIAIH